MITPRQSMADAAPCMVAICSAVRSGGVDVTATRYEGIIHDLVMLKALRGSNAANAAIAQPIDYVRKPLRLHQRLAELGSSGSTTTMTEEEQA
jgi:hypothetical protein